MRLNRRARVNKVASRTEVATARQLLAPQRLKSSDPTKGKTKADPRSPGKGDELKGKGKTVPQPGAPSNGDKGAPSKGKAKTAK